MLDWVSVVHIQRHSVVVCRLQFYKDIIKFQILCCGGDGTVGWLLDAMGLFSYIILAPEIKMYINSKDKYTVSQKNVPTFFALRLPNMNQFQ